MRLSGCLREREITELLCRGCWPDASSEELRVHVDRCRACRELVLLKQTFGGERARAAMEARLESAGVLWWKAQLWRRRAAVERIGRPLLGAQIFALVVCVAAALVYLVTQARRGFEWRVWLGDFPRALHLGVFIPDSLGKSPWEIWLGVSIAGMLALMGGVIVYLASEKR